MKKILIVEDDSAISHAYGLVLSKYGFEVIIADDARSGLKMARDENPDIILLDMLMPEMSGLDFLRELDVKKTMPTTKVIVLSNTESPKVMEDALSLGADKYLLKINFTPHEVEKIVKELD